MYHTDAGCKNSATDVMSEPVRESHIDEEMRLLHSAVAELVVTTDHVIGRLSRVLGVPLEPADSKETLEPFRVPLADDIRVERTMLQKQLVRLQDAMKVLEL